MCDCQKFAPTLVINNRTYTFIAHGGPAAHTVLPFEVIMEDLLDDMRSGRITRKQWYNTLVLLGDYAKTPCDLCKDDKE